MEGSLGCWTGHWDPDEGTQICFEPVMLPFAPWALQLLHHTALCRGWGGARPCPGGSEKGEGTDPSVCGLGHPGSQGSNLTPLLVPPSTSTSPWLRFLSLLRASTCHSWGRT